MADYQSSLTGQQMDSALTDLNNHTTLYGAEAWARGTKGGVDVGSTDPTFHNNARYYAEVAQSAVPSENGAVLWNQSQNLSASEKSQARANIACGSSNRNLLDNWWFGSGVINQRGQSSYTNQYSIDRWFAASSTVTVNSDYISIAVSSGNNGIEQRFEKSKTQNLIGKTCTLSYLYSDGTIGSSTFVFPSASRYVSEYDAKNIRWWINIGQTYDAIWLITSVGSIVTVKAVKLELGSVSTLANDTAPDTASELAKCQRYFQRFTAVGANGIVGYAIAPNASTASCIIPLFVPFRTYSNLVFSTSGTISIHTGTANFDISSATLLNSSNRTINFTGVVSGATVGSFYNVLIRTANAYIDISADL